MGQYQHLTYRAITMVRGGLVSMLYKKTTDLSVRDVDPAASLTLMSADIERIVQGWQTMHEIWANAFEIGVAIYMLEIQLGVACVVPVAVSIGELSLLYFFETELNDFVLILASLPSWVHNCHGIRSIASSNVARSNRETYLLNHFDAWFDERDQDVRPKADALNQSAPPANRRIECLKEIQEAPDLEYGILLVPLLFYKSVNILPTRKIASANQ